MSTHVITLLHTHIQTHIVPQVLHNILHNIKQLNSQTNLQLATVDVVIGLFTHKDHTHHVLYTQHLLQPRPLQQVKSNSSSFGLIGQLSTVKSRIVDPSPVGLVGLSVTFGTNPDKSHMGLRETEVNVVHWQSI